MGVVTELSWRFGLHEFAMPFFIQLTRDLTYKVEVVQKKNEDREKKEAEKTEKEANQSLNPMFDDPMLSGVGSQFPMIMSGVPDMNMGGLSGMGMQGLNNDMSGGMSGMGNNMGGSGGMNNMF